MGKSYTYAADRVAVTVNEFIITGFGEETAVEVALNRDLYSMVSGIGGDVTRSRLGDLSGTATITLQDSSPSNAIFNNFSNTGDTFRLLVEDTLGGTKLFMRVAWVQTFPNVTFARESSERVWVVAFSKLEFDLVGAFEEGNN